MANGLARTTKNDDKICKDALGKAIGILFLSRTMAHMSHLQTSSYAAHVALNEFYDGILDLADDLAEAAQGMYGKLDVPFINTNGNIKDPISMLQGHLRQLESTMVNCDEDWIMNIYQEIQKLYRSTLYKLTELS